MGPGLAFTWATSSWGHGAVARGPQSHRRLLSALDILPAAWEILRGSLGMDLAFAFPASDLASFFSVLEDRTMSLFSTADSASLFRSPLFSTTFLSNFVTQKAEGF